MKGIDIIFSFQHAVNLIGLKDNNGDKLVENGIEDIHTNEVIAKIFVAKGDHNELVRWIQQRLIALGFSCGKTGDDSYFGINTLAAVAHFQFLEALNADGFIGALTITKLLNQ